ncbi:hypothetical protein NKR17_12890 [Priestia flexa]|uniref:hypothetical protein n=1 Tax=Priestia flexa TaxID=86664 RepID=UPI00209E64DF|nr:hypothetical protein [Priestia flexa]MCP1189951.1 hypothetical protein [Priestia flexa]
MNFIAWMIVGCEIAFWIVILLGLTTRYIAKKEKMGFFLLALTPVIDLILLLVTGIDLYNGTKATTVHGIAAIYIGVSLAFGKSMIKWADERFLYYVTKQGAKPIRRFGLEHAKHGLKGWFQHLIAYAIGAGLLVVIINLLNNAQQTEALSGILQMWTLVLAIDFCITMSYFIWPRRMKATIKQ